MHKKNIKNKNPWIASILGFFFNILSMFYFGWRAFIFTLTNYILCFIIFYLILNWPFPKWGGIVFAFFWAFLNVMICGLYNEVVIGEKNKKKFNTLIFTTIDSWIWAYFCVVYGINYSIILWQEHHILKSVFIVAMGIPMSIYLGNLLLIWISFALAGLCGGLLENK